MPIVVHPPQFARLDPEHMAGWSEVPSTIASDCQNRAQAMAAAIDALDPAMRLVGQARTVACMAGDNSALHSAIRRAEPGDVLVCDGQAFVEVALFGELMMRDALNRGIAGIVLDGAVRDVAAIRELGFPCFARASVPRGPHKGFGGTVGAPVSCGGVAVASGDLIVGDADGVTVVPQARIAEVLELCRAAMDREAGILYRLADGGSLAEVYPLDDVTEVGSD